jgi:hypothetical protein
MPSLPRPRRPADHSREGDLDLSDLDPYERAVFAAPNDASRVRDAPPPEPPIPRPGFRPWHALGLLAVLVVIAIALPNHGASSGIGPNCRRVQLQLSPNRAARGDFVSYAVTGPDSAQLAIAVDTPELRSAPDGGWQPTEARGRLLGPAPLPVRDCISRNSFAVTLPAGGHRVSVFELDPARQAAHPIAVAELTVR